MCGEPSAKAFGDTASASEGLRHSALDATFATPRFGFSALGRDPGRDEVEQRNAG
jgi:hypothetical protein